MDRLEIPLAAQRYRTQLILPRKVVGASNKVICLSISSDSEEQRRTMLFQNTVEYATTNTRSYQGPAYQKEEATFWSGIRTADPWVRISSNIPL